MVTLAATQSHFEDAMNDVLELEYDALEAYKTAIHKLENKEYQNQLKEFRADHEKHIKEISSLLKSKNIKPVSGPDSGKQWLAKGKVHLANLFGDKAILQAMISNEKDTNTAYERILTHKHRWSEAHDTLLSALEDEEYHKDWLEQTVASLS